MKFLRSFVFSVLLAASLPALAQRSVDPIAAVVNGDVITQHDLDLRMTLALLNSGLADTPEMRKQVQGQVLRRLVDEDLKVQLASKEKITVTQSEIAGQMEEVERQNHLPPGGLNKLLASKGVDPEALRQQLRADIAWIKWVRNILVRRVHVSENAVNTRLEAIRANLGKPEYHAAEILLSLDGVKNEAEVRDLAQRLTEQTRQGAPFAAIAQQFNQGGGANGDLGWVSEGMMDDELFAALSALQPNQASQPIRMGDGYYIMGLIEKRKVGEGLGGGPTLDLMTIDLKSLPGAGPAERDTQMRRLRDSLAPAKSCDDITKLSKEVPAAVLSIEEKLPENQVPSKVAPLIKDLQPGQISEPTEGPSGRRFFAVCGHAVSHANDLPSADVIRRQMEDEQMKLLEQRALRDLNRGAVIEIR